MFRRLLRTPVFAGIATATLALGVGAAGAVFGVFRSVTEYRLPFPDSDRLMVVNEQSLPKYPRFSVAAGNFRSWQKESADVFAGFDLSNATSASVQLPQGPAQTVLGQVTFGWFQTFGVTPILGRSFRADEDVPGAPRVVVIGHRMWKSDFAGSTGVIGEAVIFNNEPHVIIGVMPEGYPPAGSQQAAWRPLRLTAEEESDHNSHYFQARARLRDGVTAEQAGERLNEIAARLEKEFPDSNQGWRVTVSSFNAAVTDEARPALRLLLGAMILVLLVLSANLSTLVQVRALDRRRELAVRAALGASRGALLRHALGECLALGLVGGGLGFALAHLGRDLLLRFAPGSLSSLHPGGPGSDFVAPLAALAVALGAMLVFSLAPLLKATEHGTLAALHGGNAAIGGRNRSRRVLVAAQLALTLVLLACAGLLLRGFIRSAFVDPGFEPDGAIVYRVNLPEAAYGDNASKARFAETFLGRLQTIPGVESAALGFILPFDGDWITSAAPEGRTYGPNETPQAFLQRVTPGGLRTIGYRLRAGRWLTEADNATSAAVTVVSESFARTQFGGSAALGQRIRVGGVDATGQAREIVGIVADIQQAAPGERLQRLAHVIVPFAQAPWGNFMVVLRTERAGPPLTAEVKRALQAVDPLLPLVGGDSYRDQLAESLKLSRFELTLVAIFAGATLLLSVVGVYGIAAYSASRRTREFGLRLALGAEPRHLSNLVFGEALLLTALGTLIGIPAAIGAGRLVQSQIHGTENADPLTVAAMVVILTAAVLAAAWRPARRAAGTDPAAALRAE